MKDRFAGYRSLSLEFSFFQNSVSSNCLLWFPMRNQLLISLRVHYVWWVISLLLLSGISPYLWFLKALFMSLIGDVFEYVILRVQWASWMCISMSCIIKFAIFQPSLLQIFFLPPCLFCYCGSIMHRLGCLTVSHRSVRLCLFFFLIFFSDTLTDKPQFDLNKVYYFFFCLLRSTAEPL